jgi:hypothetical protein
MLWFMTALIELNEKGGLKLVVAFTVGITMIVSYIIIGIRELDITVKNPAIVVSGIVTFVLTSFIVGVVVESKLAALIAISYFLSTLVFLKYLKKEQYKEVNINLIESFILYGIYISLL